MSLTELSYGLSYRKIEDFAWSTWFFQVIAEIEVDVQARRGDEDAVSHDGRRLQDFTPEVGLEPEPGQTAAPPARTRCIPHLSGRRSRGRTPDHRAGACPPHDHASGDALPARMPRVSPMSTEASAPMTYSLYSQGPSVSKAGRRRWPVTFTTSSLVLPVKKESPKAELK